MDIHSQVTQPAQLHAMQQGAAQECAVAEYLAFRLGEQEYAVEISEVQEIRNYERPTRMLGAPKFVSGVLNLRGSVVPIVDMRVRLGLVATLDHNTVIVVLQLPSGPVGVVVDSVSDVLQLELEDIQRMPQLNDSNEVRLFQGLGTSSTAGVERTLIVMNFQDLLPRSSRPSRAPSLSNVSL